MFTWALTERLEKRNEVSRTKVGINGLVRVSMASPLRVEDGRSI